MKRLSERVGKARTDTRSETRSGSEREIDKSGGGGRGREGGLERCECVGEKTRGSLYTNQMGAKSRFQPDG